MPVYKRGPVLGSYLSSTGYVLHSLDWRNPSSPHPNRTHHHTCLMIWAGTRIRPRRWCPRHWERSWRLADTAGWWSHTCTPAETCKHTSHECQTASGQEAQRQGVAKNGGRSPVGDEHEPLPLIVPVVNSVMMDRQMLKIKAAIASLCFMSDFTSTQAVLSSKSVVVNLFFSFEHPHVRLKLV